MACTNRKKNISNKTKQHVIHLYYICHHKQEDIAADLRISFSSVERILTRYRRDSEGLNVPTLRVPGRPRLLHAADVDVGPFLLPFHAQSHGSQVLDWLG